MRSEVIAAAAACAMAATPTSAYLHSPASITRQVGPHLSLRTTRPAHATRPRTAVMQANAEGERKNAKVLEMRKLAEEATRALEEARIAEEKAALMRRERGQKSVTLNRGSDLRTKMLLGSVGDVLYQTWASVLAGRPVDEAHDFLGLSGEILKVSASERTERVMSLFKRFDIDGSGTIDAAELAVGIKEVLGVDADERVLRELMREVDSNGDSKIDLEEFTKVCFSMMTKAEATAMQAADREAAEAAAAARTRSFSSVMQALEASGALSEESFPKVALAGNATAAVAALDALKAQGKIALWDSAPRLFQSTGADKMKAVTGMVNPEKELGLAVDAFTRFRYQGVSFLGISGALALVVAGFCPPPLEEYLVKYGYGTLAVNLVFTAFAAQLEKFNMQRLLRAENDWQDRWIRRQAGRLIGAYLCGLPMEQVTYDGSAGLIEILIFSRRTGNIDIAQLGKALEGQKDGDKLLSDFLQLGLTKAEIDRQSIVQMFGLVAEQRRHGKATLGFRFFRELDDQLDLSQTLISRRDKQIQARFGVTMSYQLLDRHAYGFEAVVQALKDNKTPAEALAYFEAAVPPAGWTESRVTPVRDKNDVPVDDSSSIL